MAGLYNDAPSRRLSYDYDGTIIHLRFNNNAAQDQSGSMKINLNTEDESVALHTAELFSNHTWILTMMFPQDMEIDGYFYSMSTNGDSAFTFGPLEDSDDSTNGIDGSWATLANPIERKTTVYTQFRDNINSLARSSKRGFRWTWKDISGSAEDITDTRAMHVYGTISPGATPDRLLFLDTENSDAVFTKVLDFAEIPRGQTQVRTFKLKNNSGSLTINTIQVTAIDNYLNAATWYTFGNDGVNYQGTYAVGNMSPGATELIYLKQIVPDGETLGLQTGRIEASHASLS